MLTVLNPFNKHQKFPEVDKALAEPNGLLAMGGCLSIPRLETAYRHGIFPWFNDNEPILWWSPDPRLILWPDRLKISRSLEKCIKKGTFDFSFDKNFAKVMDACAAPRASTQGTWISSDIKKAYNALHQHGLAHSFESWQSGELVGGLYGVAIGRVFFGESMFHTVTDASKAAMVFACACLVDWGYELIDCQVHTGHLASLGAVEIPRSEFVVLLAEATRRRVSDSAWQTDSEPSLFASARHPWPD